ncbi:hypothetical protein F0562_030747 [Nyssa sinensis]|uniref:DUF632 domain-containing protein n=1 Tax=Nyssa sinensis TaxID=561372 RepID=A0A5J5B3J5_9ASTE|nr:hypothetical protein F0562_030747 [Nyssa sinensis]
MGCSTSKLDDAEVVQLCKDRKKFIKQAVEHSMQFASGHIAYIQSLERVSAALRDYVEGDEPREFLFDSFTIPPFTPIKKTSLDFISGLPKSSSVTPIQSEPTSALKINYLRSGGNSSVYCGGETPITGNSSYSPNNRPNFPPPSPQNSKWDFFWNPFSSLDYYGYPTRSNIDQTVLDNEITGMTQIPEEQGIPELEERAKADGSQSIEVSEVENAGPVSNQETPVGDREATEETPGFTVYVNRKPTSIVEVIKDLEAQFMIVYNSANEVSAMLKASSAPHSSTANELTATKMLNPVALFRSTSSGSSSSRFLINSSGSRDEGYGSRSTLSEESFVLSGSHQSTLNRLYAWEKKLHEEVRNGERFRIAYERKCMQLRNQDVKVEDLSSADKTTAIIRDLHTQIQVSVHSVESISKRIEALRDEELQPQLVELIQGLSRMWKVMAECHQWQKCTLDEAKLLLTSSPSAKKYTIMMSPHRLANSAANLETELRNWRACFESWITSQRSYVHALTSWLLRCVHSNPNTSKLPFSSCRSAGALPVFGICIQWSRFFDTVHEVPVLDGLDFFVAGMSSLYAQQLREDSRQNLAGSKRFRGGLQVESSGNMEVVEVGQLEKDMMTEEKMAEVAIRILWAGLSSALNSLTEFAIASAEGYADLVKQWENVKLEQSSAETGK